MPRSTSGTYSQPSGAFTTGTVIRSDTMNEKFGDLATEMTDSLSRSGNGDMLAPLRLDDGSAPIPSLSFTADPEIGLYLAAVNDCRMVSAAANLQKWTTTGVTVYPAATLESTLTVKGNTTLGDANTDTTTVKGPATLESTLAVTGNTTVTGTTTSTGVLGTNAGGETFQLKPGSQDHTYMGFYARTATPTVRSGFIGYASGAAATELAIKNSIASGTISLSPGTGGTVITTGNVVFSGVSNPSNATAYSNTITPANVIKAHAKATVNAGAVTVNGGFNLTASVSGNNIRFTFPVGGTMSNANYTATVKDTLGPQYKTTISSPQTTHFDVAASELVLSGGVLVETARNLSTLTATLYVTVVGPQ